MTDTTSHGPQTNVPPAPDPTAQGTIAFAKYGDPSLPHAHAASATQPQSGVGVEWVYPSELQRRASVALTRRAAKIAAALHGARDHAIGSAVTQLRSVGRRTQQGPGL